MPLDTHTVERLRCDLDAPLELAEVTLNACEVGLRAAEVVAGREALRMVKLVLGEDPDERVTLPAAHLSLSHDDRIAVAVGCPRHEAAGLGVDIERMRDIRPEAARFYLQEVEQLRIDTSAREPCVVSLLRLWTVKEAVFKADLGNAGRILLDYRISDAAAWSGEAVGPAGGGFRCRYSTVWTNGRFLSVARAHRYPTSPLRKDPTT